MDSLQSNGNRDLLMHELQLFATLSSGQVQAVELSRPADATVADLLAALGSRVPHGHVVKINEEILEETRKLSDEGIGPESRVDIRFVLPTKLAEIIRRAASKEGVSQIFSPQSNWLFNSGSLMCTDQCQEVQLTSDDFTCITYGYHHPVSSELD